MYFLWECCSVAKKVILAREGPGIEIFVKGVGIQDVGSSVKQTPGTIWTFSRFVPSNMVANSHMHLLGPQNVASTTGELHFLLFSFLKLTN